MTLRVAFRADAAARTGLGHLKRCLALADALRALGARTAFFLRRTDVDGRAIVAAGGHEATLIADGTLDPSQDAQRADAAAFCRAAQAFGAQRVVVDHYGLDATWHRPVAQSTGAALVAIDDLADRPLEVDWLVDHNLAPDHARKYAGRLRPGTRLLTGPRHALLAAAYAEAPRCEPAGRVDSVGIFMGGTDADGHSQLALDALRAAGHRGAVEVVSTRANPNLGRLCERIARDPTARLSLDLPDLAGFYPRHDLHLGAGGGATWERCCLGAPTLALIVAPNQREVLLPLQDLGVIEVLAADPPTPEALQAALRPLLADADRRRALSQAARTLVDGHGARRVAEALLLPPPTRP
jgi:UDP-2,4-diacetamido-2,4,6-trideoxy-beta-L-altropyranose hydrolase